MNERVTILRLYMIPKRAFCMIVQEPVPEVSNVSFFQCVIVLHVTFQALFC